MGRRHQKAPPHLGKGRVRPCVSVCAACASLNLTSPAPASRRPIRRKRRSLVLYVLLCHALAHSRFAVPALLRRCLPGARPLADAPAPFLLPLPPDQPARAPPPSPPAPTLLPRPSPLPRSPRGPDGCPRSDPTGQDGQGEIGGGRAGGVVQRCPCGAAPEPQAQELPTVALLL